VENRLQKHLVQKPMKAPSTAKPEQSRHHGSSDRGSHGQAQHAMAVTDSRPELEQQQGVLSLMAGSLRLQRKCACGAPSAAGGTCAACEEKASGASSPMLQKMMMIGAADDPLEREADRVAEQVMRTPESQLERSCPCGGGCPKCQTEQPGRENESLQTNPVQASDTGQSAAPPTVHEVLRSSGEPLDPATRAFMEPRFGYDFSRVRVHTGAAAAQSARDVNAQAYAVGRDVVFGGGRFAPGTYEGRKLLAHELAHVVQHNSRLQSTLMRVPDKDGIVEREPRYSYSTHCGWIDWHHANPDMSKRLIQAVQDASDRMAADPALSSEAVTGPAMESHVPVLGALLSSVTPVFRIKTKLTHDEVLGVAFRAFVLQSLGFEALQSWTDAIGESSFSEEDLTSNLIAFYMAARTFDRAQIKTICDVWDATRSLEKFKSYRFQRVHQFRPRSLPAGGSFPADLQTIVPAQTGGPLMTAPVGVFRTTGSVFTRGLSDYQVILNTALRIESLSGSMTIDISGTVPGSANGPHFKVTPLPAAHGLKCRWVIRLPDNDRIMMLGDDESDVFRDFGTQFNAYINAPSRQLLRERNVTRATVLCRMRLGDVGSDASHERLLELPVSFIW
jgi:hypothetical protein